jgi:pyruvate dehydrogenase E1 component beta subunit
VVCPSTPYDAKGLLKASIRDDNPIVFMESELQYNNTGEVPDDDYVIPLGVADVKREGKDVTLIAWAKMVDIVLEAAAELESIGVNAEVVDPRTLRPLDMDTLAASVKKTGRCVIVEVGWPMCGVGGEIAYQLQRECLDYLDSPVERVCSEDVPMPYAKNLEQEVMPQVSDVVRAVKKVLYLD